MQHVNLSVESLQAEEPTSYQGFASRNIGRSAKKAPQNAPSRHLWCRGGRCACSSPGTSSERRASSQPGVWMLWDTCLRRPLLLCRCGQSGAGSGTQLESQHDSSHDTLINCLQCGTWSCSSIPCLENASTGGGRLSPSLLHLLKRLQRAGLGLQSLAELRKSVGSCPLALLPEEAGASSSRSEGPRAIFRIRPPASCCVPGHG